MPSLACASTEEPAALCEWASTTAAQEAGIPEDILGALTLTETGRRRDGVVRPWAWSANSEGDGTWFDDPAAAVAFAESRVAAGRHNLDIGCFQLNYRWHGENFSSVGEMFDPLANARYAAKFVSQLYGEMGDWRRAAGAFHSRTPSNANRYLARFDELRSTLQRGGFGDMRGTAETYNRFASADPGLVAGLPQPSRQVRIVEKRMLLGAPLGTAVTGAPGSLAAIGGQRVALLSSGRPLIGQRRRPLFGPGASAMPAEELIAQPSGPSEPAAEPEYPVCPADEPCSAQADVYLASIPDAGPAPQGLSISGEEPL